MIFKHKISVIGALAWAVCAAVPVTAQTAQGDTLVDNVTKCLTEVDDAKRLVCLDRAARALAAARAGNEISVMSRDDVRAKRRALFGLALPSVNLFGRADDKVAQVDSLESTVTKFSWWDRGKVIFHLADNSVWRTTEVAPLEPAIGRTVKIRRGVLGGYFGNFDEARNVRIERVR